MAFQVFDAPWKVICYLIYSLKKKLKNKTSNKVLVTFQRVALFWVTRMHYPLVIFANGTLAVLLGIKYGCCLRMIETMERRIKLIFSSDG